QLFCTLKENDFVKPDEACERYCKREQRKFTFNLSSAAISYPKSKTKFVHARGEKSHLKKNINQQKKKGMK
ncbi:hypothetical protein, partial [Prevotella disiens]